LIETRTFTACAAVIIFKPTQYLVVTWCTIGANVRVPSEEDERLIFTEHSISQS